MSVFLQDGNHRTLTNKVLYYDADGNGSDAAVAFAVLTGVSTLNATDFLIM